MDRRTYEGPMDWEYQNSGPFDPTSPFTHAAKSNSQNGKFTFTDVTVAAVASTIRDVWQLFANRTPSKTKPPQSSFTPQLSSRTTAPAFRNPAFTTPRRPFDDVVLSEASGAEDSPALTEVSDFPNDTPEADRMSDINMNGMTSPSKIDKSFRYSKTPFSSKKHTPGRGEIRATRDLSVSEFIRKRKRHNLDRDVSSITRHRWTESDSDSEDSIAPRRTRGKKATKEAPRGFLGSLLHMLDEHPNAPDNLYRWVKLIVNFFLVSVFVYIGWSIVTTVKTDIENANEMARIEIMGKITECQTQYSINGCAKNDRPALRVACEEWSECMTQNPEAIMRVKVTAKQIAEIINEFSEAMNLKAWGFFFAVLIFCAFANNFFLGGYVSKPAPPIQSQPAAPPHDPSMAPENGPGFMWVPVQTPRMQRHMLLDDGTDTDSTPPPKMKTILAPPYTPSLRRSPSKTDRGRSPIKNRSPSKGRREPFA
ncbi:nucleus export BRL1 [Fusarium globosum]|uniref:Nucleus export BRL1 n=1 Tax=Fusarium globosum TaxID=78864 RepID=A0A8H5YZ70_9HYPO|nr:nucleus export BRL1 [Fusarium globosum]